MSLTVYRKKRDFKKTKEPKGLKAKDLRRHSFVIQKHDASHLHYDFRLELDGVLKSWAVPKGPSLSPGDKRLAVQVEDHPVSYANFEGEIPADEYGGGHVIVWDRGVWTSEKDPHNQIKKGRLEFELKGEKLSGSWLLVRTARSSSKKPNWLLIKRHDSSADSEVDVTDLDKSVISDVTIEELKAGADLKKATKLKIKKLKSPKMIAKEALKQVKRSMPKQLEPQLAYLADKAPMGDQWIHEVKYDGYRTLVHAHGKNIQLLTRSGLDWTAKYKTIHDELKKIKAQSFILDGEIVVQDENGATSFQDLQNALEENRPDRLSYFIFDLLYLNGHDLRELPLIERKTLLSELLQKSKTKNIYYSEHWIEDGDRIFKGACRLNLEGIISKDKTRGYESGRSRHWLKTKCKNTQEFVIVGYTLQKNNAVIGALLLGAYNSEGLLEFAGRTGTGFDSKTQTQLLSQLKKIRRKTTALEVKAPREKKTIWVEPKLVANIEFSNWTQEHVLRHSSFQGLRKDKKAKDVKLQEAKATKAKVKSSKTKTKHNISSEKPNANSKLDLSNPAKILFSKAKVTKFELAQYYLAHQKLIMPHIEKRPLSLLRCPNGEKGECFFQKHITGESDAIHKAEVTSKLKKKTEEIFYVDSIEGVLETIQLGSLELHVRGGHYDKIDKADVIVFDFDPDPSVSFLKVKKAALDLRKLLLQLKLKSFIKVTGGKGLHVHVPIAAKYDWDTIKNFSRTVCERMVEDQPNLYTTEISKIKRKRKIFLDYLRNGYGATAILPYSVRARANASIAWPIRWEDLKSIKSSDQFTVKNIAQLKKRSDPWTGYFKLKQIIQMLE